MAHTRLGASGLKVSRIALGCMSFGDPAKRRERTLDDHGAEPFFRQALDLGTFWDTANVYAQGTSEELVGRALKKYTSREEIVLATKIYWPMHAGPGGSGLSHKAIFEQVDASLAPLGVDSIDLLQIHRFDPETPVQETMEALHVVLRPRMAARIIGRERGASRSAGSVRRRSSALSPRRAACVARPYAGRVRRPRRQT